MRAVMVILALLKSFKSLPVPLRALSKRVVVGSSQRGRQAPLNRAGFNKDGDSRSRLYSDPKQSEDRPIKGRTGRLFNRARLIKSTSDSSLEKIATKVPKSAIEPPLNEGARLYREKKERSAAAKLAAATASKEREALGGVKDYKIKAARENKLYNDKPHMTPETTKLGSSVGLSSNSDEEATAVKNRPFTLPPGLFRPKQSLGQNFLSDQNYVEKSVNALEDSSEGGIRVVEIGPGSGAITRVLHKKYPKMTAIEIDQRAVKFLSEKIPGLECKHMNVLTADWTALADEKGGRINVLGNLPYYITSQVLFSLADHHRAIDKAVVTMQLEVAERICARPRTKDYGIPSVVFQLYGAPKMNFKIPPSVFFPQPKVDSALITIDFTAPHPQLIRSHRNRLRSILTYSFQQRRKMLRVSLKDMLQRDGLILPDKWSQKRPEELTPGEFLELTLDLYGGLPDQAVDTDATSVYYSGDPVWRVALMGGTDETDSAMMLAGDILDDE